MQKLFDQRVLNTVTEQFVITHMHTRTLWLSDDNPSIILTHYKQDGLKGFPLIKLFIQRVIQHALKHLAYIFMYKLNELANMITFLYRSVKRWIYVIQFCQKKETCGS